MSQTATEPSPTPLLPRTIPATQENAKLLVEVAIRIVLKDAGALVDLDPHELRPAVDALRHLNHALNAINSLDGRTLYSPIRD